MIAFIHMIGPWELGAILLLVLMVFGAGGLPDVMRQLGRAFRTVRQLGKDEDA